MTEFQTFLNLSPDPSCLLTAGGQFNLVNKSFEEAAGFPGYELMSKSFFDYLHPEEKEAINSKLNSLVPDSAHQFVSRFRTVENQYKYLWWNAKKLPDGTIYVSGRDIDHQKNNPAEKVVDPPVENYKILFQLNPMPIVIYDVESLAVIDVNLAAAKLYGYSCEEFTQLTVKDFYLPNEVPIITQSLKQHAFNAEIKNLGVWSHLKKDGSVMEVQVTGHSITYLNRHRMIVVCNDITHQAEVLLSLERSIERFEYVTEATADIIWDWDLTTDEIYYSSNMEKLFGHGVADGVGDINFFARNVHPEDRERVVQSADTFVYGTKKYWMEEYRFRKANGEYAFIVDKGIVIRDESGIGTRMIGAMQDITELKHNELHIAKQNSQLIEIAYLNAHITRRPIANILGLVNLIDKSTITDRDTFEVLNNLETATAELDTAIRSIIVKAGD